MITVTNPQSGAMLHFSHDAASRSVTGPSAAMILATAERWSGLGVIYGTQSVVAPDPLGSESDMAVMLATFGYVLPESLWRLLPKQEPSHTGAVAEPGAHNAALAASLSSPRSPALGRARRRGRSQRADDGPCN